MRDEIEQFQQAGVQPFGVNPATVESHLQYARKFRFNFPLLSDDAGAVASAYGALKAGGKSVIRSVVLIDRDGRVAFAERGAPRTARILAPLGG